MVDSYPLVRNPTKESIARFFLSFGHIFKIYPFILSSFIFGNRLICAKATIFIFFSMIYNTLLKYTFKVPLNPHLGQGFSFPSGHMHAYGLFYGYYFLHLKNSIFGLIFLIIFIGIAISLVYMRYHKIFDVCGAILFVIFELIIDHFLSAKYGEKFTISIIFTICLISIFCLYLKIHQIQYHIWLAIYSIIGITVAFYVIQGGYGQNFLQKCLALLLTLTVRWILTKIWDYFDFDEFYLSEVPFILSPILTIYALKFSLLVKLPDIFIDKIRFRDIKLL